MISTLIFLKNFQKLMKETGWSQGELANKTGINRVLINKYLTGNTIPGLDAIEAISEAFGVTPSEMLAVKEPTARLPEISPAEALEIIKNALEIHRKVPRDVLEMLSQLTSFDSIRAAARGQLNAKVKAQMTKETKPKKAAV